MFKFTRPEFEQKKETHIMIIVTEISLDSPIIRILGHLDILWQSIKPVGTAC